MQIRGTTKVIGVLGWPVGHSLSPLMQGAGLEAAGLDWVYVPFPVHPDRVGEAVKGIRALGLVGVNVTIPHKQAVIPFLDEVDPNARRIGAVNTIKVESDGRLVGFNTDSEGAYEAMEVEAKFTVEGKRVTIVGAGGAARALAFGAAARGAAAVATLNWDPERDRAVALASDLSEAFPAVETAGMGIGDPGARELVEKADLLAQASPVGMKPSDPFPLPVDWVPRGITVFDAVYTSDREHTRFLEVCRGARGCETIGGLEMLLYQGVRSFRIWTGVEPDVSAMRQALRSALRSK